ncbi:hypothetical protein SAMN02910314_01104 [Denitrobacterium detoxificans]|uniref:Uncharacterized protein n=1 Tax=Denitrobacterium detoxificans TaxID=79604 RepID=A0A1H8SCX0_9ACTN|nr:hypothetical protein SAMN02910314_01104 [Denitrobacterium detoxificans]
MDSVIAKPDSFTWKNIESDLDSFVAEYLSSSSPVACSPQSFIRLVNAEMTADSRKRLAKSYRGEIALFTDVKDSSVWRILLQNAKVSSTISNALSYLEVVGPTGDWVAFVNGFEGFSLKKSDCSEASLSVVRAQINNFNSLDDDKFKSFLGLLDTYSISNIPSNLSDEKIRLMFDMRIPVLSRHSLSVMHDKYAGGFCLPYIEGDIDAYMSCVAYTSPSDEELSAVLALSCVHTKDYRASLVNMLRSRIALNADYDDETAQVLLDRGRLSSSGVAAAFERFGESVSLDKALVGYAASLSVNGLIELNVDRRIVVEVIRESSFRKRLDVLGKLCDWDWRELVEALHAFGLEELDSILNKRHPKVDQLSGETRQVVSLLEGMGYVTISSDGRVYIAKSKRHR